MSKQTFRLPFTKMQGAGNDVIVLNAMQGLPALSAAHFQHLGDRRYGIGCDQILIVAPPKDAANDFSYRIVNQDGSEVEHCGNGARCFMRFVRDQGLTAKKVVRVEIATGVIILSEFDDGEVEVNMGAPRFEPLALPFVPAGLASTTLANGFVTYQMSLESQIMPPATTQATPPFGTVSMGNPHCITFVDDVAAIDLEKIGPQFEHNPAFPQRTNSEFIEVVRPDYLKMRVWERGAGITLACGTGACAALVAAVLNGKSDRKATIALPGGPLLIEWAADDKIFMTGPAERAFTGSVAI